MHDSAARGSAQVQWIVGVAVLVVLALMAVPVAGSLGQDEDAERIVESVRRYRSACERYRRDTRRHALELSQRKGAFWHQLSMKPPDTPGWKGPYLDHPLSKADNPFGAHVGIVHHLSHAGGFDRDGDGALESAGLGNFVAFVGVEEDCAENVDAALDRDLPGDWTRSGSVKFVDGNLLILLTQD